MARPSGAQVISHTPGLVLPHEHSPNLRDYQCGADYIPCVLLHYTVSVDSPHGDRLPSAAPWFRGRAGSWLRDRELGARVSRPAVAQAAPTLLPG
ncbi:MAG TPA: hypothetical protein VN837_01050 [Chloroflexota bacterium]|nr:hypothetical protein [Chloroflexota bacterium]